MSSSSYQSNMAQQKLKQEHPAEVIELDDDDDDAFWSSLSIKSEHIPVPGSAALAAVLLLYNCCLMCPHVPYRTVICKRHADIGHGMQPIFQPEVILVHVLCLLQLARAKAGMSRRWLSCSSR
jgi:hypothetical protein